MDMYKRFKNPEGTFKERYPKITCLRNFNNLLPWKKSSEQAGTFLSSSPSLSPKTIAFIPSGAKTQKKEILPYPRCGFGACLRCRQYHYLPYRFDSGLEREFFKDFIWLYRYCPWMRGMAYWSKVEGFVKRTFRI